MLKKFITGMFIVLLTAQTAVFAETVVFNTQTKKIHNINCPSAQKCTKSCIKIDRKEALKRGGVPCKTCGG